MDHFVNPMPEFAKVGKSIILTKDAASSTSPLIIVSLDFAFDADGENK